MPSSFKAKIGESINDSPFVVVEPEGLPQDSFKGPEFQKGMQRKGRGRNQYSHIDAPDILSNHTISCTSCLQQINPFALNSVFEHPVLHVILCKSCFDYYFSGEFDQDEDGIDNYCRWCGDGGMVTVCENCSYVFCRSCIRRHVTRKEYNRIKEESWLCFVCDPAPIQDKIDECRNVLSALREYNKKTKSSSKIKKKSPKSQSKLGDIDTSSVLSSDGHQCTVTKTKQDDKLIKSDKETSDLELLPADDTNENESTSSAIKSLSESPSADWKTKFTQKLEDIADSLQVLTQQFQSQFDPVKIVKHKKNDFKAVLDLKSSFTNVYSQAKNLNQLFKSTSKRLKSTNDFDEDSSTTAKESDSDVLSSPSKRKMLRKRKDLNISRLSSSNETDSPIKRKSTSDSFLGSKSEVTNEEDSKPYIPNMTGVLIKTELLSSSALSDTGSSKMFRRKSMSKNETYDSVGSISDIFEPTATSESAKPKRKLVSSSPSSKSETNNSESLLNPSVNNTTESAKKRNRRAKRRRKTSDADTSTTYKDSDATNVDSDTAISDDQVLPSLDAVGIESDSNSAATDDAGLAAEKNKIALENLKSLTRQEENDEDLDEDVKDLLEKDNKKKTKPAIDRTSDAMDDNDDLVKKKQASYNNPLLKLRITSSDSEGDGIKKKQGRLSKRRVSSGSQEENPKKPKVELMHDEALNDPFLSDDDARLLNKDIDDEVDDLQLTDVDVLLSDEELKSKKKSLSAESTNDSESRKSPLSEETLVNGREGGKTSEEETGVSNDEAGSRLSKMSETRTDASAPYSDMTSTAKKSSSVLSSDSDLPEISVSAKKKSEFKRMRLKIEEMSSDDDFRTNSSKSSVRRSKPRRKIISDSDNDDDPIEINDSSSEDEFRQTGRNGRRNIRKIFDEAEVSQDTRTAEKIEMERRKRLEECEDEAEVIVIEDDTSPVKKVVAAALLLSRNPLVEVHPSIVRVLKEHQIDGVKFLWRNVVESISRAASSKGDGCVLAHCMGLGKTLQVIAFLHTVLTSSELPGLNTALIICPLGTVANWGIEFRKWTSKCQNQLRVIEFEKKPSHDSAMSLKQWQRRGGVVILSYAKYRNICLGKRKSLSKQYLDIYRNCLQKPGPDIVVCDEGHVLKNEKTDLSSVMDEIQTKRRIVLTGTPLQNNLMEYHCMVSFVKPRLLGSKKEFSNRFVNPILNGQHVDSTKRDVHLMKKRSHVLHELLSGCVQRRDVDCLRDHLTPKFEYVISVRLSPLQIRLYEHYMKAFRCEDLQGRRGTLFQDFNHFLLICCHPRVLLLHKARTEETERAKDDQADLRRFVVENDDEDEDDEDSNDDDNLSKSSDDKKITVASLGEMSISELKKLIRDNDADCTGCINKSDLIERAKQALNLEAQGDEIKKSWFDPILPTQDELIKAVDHSGKMILLLEILRLAAQQKDKVVVFSQSLLTLDLIEIILKERSKVAKFNFSIWKKDWDYFRIDGSICSKKRNIQIDRFNSKDQPRARLFLISTRAGGIGVNLVGANRAVIFDASWNPTHDVQSIFRIYRFGQDKPCYIYRLIAQGTMEEKIYERQVLKQSLAFRVVDEQQIERHFTSNDIQELYSFKPKPLTKKSQDDETPEQAPPKDVLLAELLRGSNTRDQIVAYHQHDSLLDHQVEEELTEEERRLAWDEYDRERHPPVKESDPLMRISLDALARLLQIVKQELKRNESLLEKCKERPLSDIMLSLKIRNRELPVDKLQEHATDILLFQTHLKKRLENSRRVLIHKLEQLQFCNQVRKTASSSASPNSAAPRMQSSSTTSAFVPTFTQPNVQTTTASGSRTFASNVRPRYAPSRTQFNPDPRVNYTDARSRYPPYQQRYPPSASRFPPYGFSQRPQQGSFNFPYGPR